MAHKPSRPDEAYAEALRRIAECRKRGEEGTALGLNSLGLSSLPPDIGQLKSVTELGLYDSNLASLPPEIGQLKSLTRLDLGANALTSLPAEIGQLQTLTTLELKGNRLRSLPPEIGQLRALTTLDVGLNQLTSLPPEIGRLDALMILDLKGNQLTSLPPEIGQLRRLKTLNLRLNQLTSLPPEIGQLNTLETLNLRLNQLRSLPPEIGQLTALEALYLHDNPSLGLPVEVLGPRWDQIVREKGKPKPPKEILEYYFASRRAGLEEGTEPLMEAKVLVLGEASVGKTCLIAALSEGKKRSDLDGKGTSGIIRKLWAVPVKEGTLASNAKEGGVETLRLNCWDFGGQEIYHSAHTLFLTQRAVYLIVISKRENERQNNIDYWLRMAISFGGPDAVIFVVVNKDDEKVGHPPDEQALQRKYPQIRGFLRTSCEDLSGIAEARESIVRAALQLKGVRLPVPKKWLAVKKQLEKMQERTLSMDEWGELCRKKEVAGDDARRELLHLCDLLGTVRYFPTTLRDRKKTDAPELCETTILNPEWVTLGIYALFDDDALQKRGGLLDRGQMAGILNKRGYPAEQERIIEEVMRRFDLLYDSVEHGPEHRMLIPLLLPKSEPKMDWPSEGTLNFVYQYEVMPAGLVPAFTARMHKALSTKLSPWRYGCVLEIRACQVRVIGDAELKRVHISVIGSDPLRREALDQVRFTFDSLHEAVDNLPVQELIPVPGHPDAPMLKYSHMRSLEWQGIETYPAEGSRAGETISVNVREALDGVRGPDKKQRDQQQQQHILVQGDYIAKLDQSTNIAGDANASQVAHTMSDSENKTARS